MITDGSAAVHSLPKEFTSTGSHAASNQGSPLQHTPSKPQESISSNQKLTTSGPNPAAARRPSEPRQAVSTPTIIRTSVVKGDHGIGLDLVKSPNGRACIQKLKEMPPGVVNPASLCVPPIVPGDIIVGVNGKACGLFADTIKIIRGLDNGRPIDLQLERVE